MRFGLALALTVWAGCLAAQGLPFLTLDGRITVHTGLASVGGLSALALSGDGRQAQAISDRGALVALRLTRDERGALTAATVTSFQALYGADPMDVVDAEGLAIGADDSLYISTERDHAVLHYPAGGFWPDRIDLSAQAFRAKNQGVEALAHDREGRLLAIPEAPPDGGDSFPVWILRDGAWTKAGTFPRQGDFLVVGADLGPDGKLYVLERAASLLGFRSRLRRLDPTDIAGAAAVLFTSRLGQFDNLEGVDVWRDPTGRTRITLISDDNFMSIQTTEIVEFILKE